MKSGSLLGFAGSTHSLTLSGGGGGGDDASLPVLLLEDDAPEPEGGGMTAPLSLSREAVAQGTETKSTRRARARLPRFL